MEVITIALAKGRLAEQSIQLMEDAGLEVGVLRDQGRKLVFEGDGLRFILVKPGDVPTYVDHGVADIGIVGKDTLMEENRPLYELLDLGFGRCRLCIAGSPGVAPANGYFRVATKFVNIAQQIFEARGENIEIIKLGGSVELGPLVGLSDVILDLVESGDTLRANGLAILEEICPISARLVVNRVSLKTKNTRIRALIDALERELKRREEIK